MEISKEVKAYDFTKPERISKDQMRNVQLLHENFTRSVTVELSALLRAVLNISLLDVSQMIYSEMVGEWSDPDCIAIIDAPPLEGNMVIEISPEFLFAAIDRLLGGDGRSQAKVREFSEIERVLLKRVFKRILDGVKDIWHTLIKLEPKLIEIEENPQFVQVFSPNEVLLRVKYMCKMGDVEGHISIGVPFIMLEPLMPKLGAQYMLRASQGQGSKMSKEHVNDMDMVLSAQFPSIIMGLSQFMALRPGHIIDLRIPVQDRIYLVANNRKLFKGKLGRQRNSLAVKIEEVIKTD